MGLSSAAKAAPSRFFQVFVPSENEFLASWRWLKPDHWQTLDDVLRGDGRSAAATRGVREARPVQRFPHCRSEDTALAASRKRTHRQPSCISTYPSPRLPRIPTLHLSFSMEGTPDQPPSALDSLSGLPSWNSIQAVNKFQTEIGGPLRRGDPGVRIFKPSPKNGQAYFFDRAPRHSSARKRMAAGSDVPRLGLRGIEPSGAGNSRNCCLKPMSPWPGRRCRAVRKWN